MTLQVDKEKSGKVKSPTPSNDYRDRMIFYLALIVIGVFFIFYGSALYAGIFSNPKDYTGVEKVAATLGSIMAGVIGYYFGQKPVEKLTNEVQQSSSEKEAFREDRDKFMTNYLDVASKLALT